MLGLSPGGNKTRKLEFLVADAKKKGCDTLVTCGAIQSNHCRITCCAAIQEGMKCHIVLEERVPNTYDPGAAGNNLLFNLFGAASVKKVAGGTNLKKEMEAIADDLRKEGKNPYVIPTGGSNEIGAMGYAAALLEMDLQCKEKGIKPRQIVTCTGSSGTHTGLVVGMSLMHARGGAYTKVMGISNNRKHAEQVPLVQGRAQAAADLLGLQTKIDEEQIVVVDDYVGEGYARPTEGMVKAVKVGASVEGLLLDPIYTGKAFDGLLQLVAKGEFTDQEDVVFIHTGGEHSLHYCPHLWL